MIRIFMAVVALLAVSGASSHADSLRVFAAGSLTDGFSDLMRRFPAGLDSVAPPEFGPSGLLRQKIEAGADVDVLASADMGNARFLLAGHPERQVIHYTDNRLCALARPAVGMTTENMLDRLLDPAVRIATSTPGADPGGDYAWLVFARAEAVHPGTKATLEAKALKLVGGGDKTPLLVPGKGAVEGVFVADKADVMLGYCSSGAPVQRAIPSLVNVPLPPSLSVAAAYGMVLMNDKPLTLRFAAFVMSERGQSILRGYGFAPLGNAEVAKATPGVVVHRAGMVPISLAPERLAALATISQKANLGGHAQEAIMWSGPLLWDVLVAAGAVDPAKFAEQVHLVVRVTGSDGYVAVLALGEISPEFGGRKVQLADRANGATIDSGPLHLVVPDEKRGGRSVRDVVRIDID